MLTSLVFHHDATENELQADRPSGQGDDYIWRRAHDKRRYGFHHTARQKVPARPPSSVPRVRDACATVLAVAPVILRATAGLETTESRDLECSREKEQKR